MATKKGSAQVDALIGDVEALAKRLRTEIRKQRKSIPKDLKVTAGRLRKRAAHAAAQVEKYVHEVRIELEAKPKARKKAAKRPARKRAK